MDAVIRIVGMRFLGRHGANPGERDRPQPIEMDVEISMDATRACASDDVRDALDYAEVFQTCRAVVTERSFALLETLATACLDAIMMDPRAASVCIRVRKPGLLEGATPGVEIARSR